MLSLLDEPNRWSGVLVEVKRKSIHVIPGFAAIPIVVWLGKPVALPIASFFFAIYLVHEIALRKNLNIRVPIASHTFKIMARRDEVEKKYFTGTVYFWFMTILLILLLEPIDAAAAVMVSSLGDATAAITGRALPKPKLPYNKRKSVAGLSAMIAVSFLSCLIAGVPWTTATIVSTTAGLVESLTLVSVLDELTVPITAGVLLWLLP